MKYEIRVLSRHPSHRILRRKLSKLPVRSVVRLGSTTEITGRAIEINSVSSVKISSDKKLMKEKFLEAKIKTAPHVSGTTYNEIIDNLAKANISYPIMAKSRNGSRGIGNTLIEDQHHLRNWSESRDLRRYIFEQYFNYALEYRLHITKDGCFYTCRKALRKDRDKDRDFQRHVENTVWFLETNEQFRRPNSWKDIVDDCVKALKSIGADVLSFDVRVQSENNNNGTKRKYQSYIIIESNSASSMSSNEDGSISICAQKYLDILPKLIMDKAEVKNND